MSDQTNQRSAQVEQLPISGFDDINHTLTKYQLQGAENSKYDPKGSMYVKEGFCTADMSSAIAVIGGLCIVYGLIT